MRFAIAVGLSLFWAEPLAAQDIVPPPIENFTVPVIDDGRDTDVVRNGWKYFYFWRADTTYEEAYSDFADCYRFLPQGNPDIALPQFVLWHDEEALDDMGLQITSDYGVVGVVVGAALYALVSGPIERRAAQSRMRRCMEPRGYERYPANRDDWEAIIDDYSEDSIAISAILASGEAPNADPLPEDR